MSLLNLTPDMSTKLARCYITPLKEDGSPDEDLGSKGLPFWPETVSDSKGADWNEKPIPGGSHPLYQWSCGSARSISFTITLSRDSQYDEPSEMMDEDVYNIDVAGAITWLRAMIYPLYDPGTNLAKPPPRLLLWFPKTKIGGTLDGDDSIMCIMRQCDVEYQAWFNDGTPRLAQVTVSFDEVLQDPKTGGVMFYGRDLMYESASYFFLNPKPGTL